MDCFVRASLANTASGAHHAQVVDPFLLAAGPPLPLALKTHGPSPPPGHCLLPGSALPATDGLRELPPAALGWLDSADTVGPRGRTPATSGCEESGADTAGALSASHGALLRASFLASPVSWSNFFLIIPLACALSRDLTRSSARHAHVCFPFLALLREWGAVGSKMQLEIPFPTHHIESTRGCASPGGHPEVLAAAGVNISQGGQTPYMCSRINYINAVKIWLLLSRPPCLLLLRFALFFSILLYLLHFSSFCFILLRFSPFPLILLRFASFFFIFLHFGFV